jgi:hypothetical protein
MVTSTPVRIGRVSSREAARPTLLSVSTNGSRPTVKPPDVSKADICGKSLATHELSEKRALPLATSIVLPSLSSTTTSSPERFLTTSVNRRAGTTASPSRSTVVASEALMEISMSVE